MFEEFLNQYKQMGKADKTIQNYLTTWTTFEKWIRLSDPDLEDAGFATQRIFQITRDICYSMAAGMGDRPNHRLCN